MAKKERSKLMHAHPDFIKMVRIEAALQGKTMIAITKQLAKDTQKIQQDVRDAQKKREKKEYSFFK